MRCVPNYSVVGSIMYAIHILQIVCWYSFRYGMNQHVLRGSLHFSRILQNKQT